MACERGGYKQELVMRSTPNPAFRPYDEKSAVSRGLYFISPYNEIEEEKTATGQGRGCRQVQGHGRGRNGHRQGQ